MDSESRRRDQPAAEVRMSDDAFAVEEAGGGDVRCGHSLLLILYAATGALASNDRRCERAGQSTHCSLFVTLRATALDA
jgi:hypothetical protein